MTSTNPLQNFTDQELQDELKRREQIKHVKRMYIVMTCKHEWEWWSSYGSKGKDCKKCGAQY